MKILAIDTSNQPLVVSLAEDDKLLDQYETNVPRNHSVDLLPAIQRVLATAGWSFQDLDRIAVAQGPGSFTGLRIGITVGKVLADMLKIDLVGVSSLAVLAEQVPGVGIVVPLFDARNDNVFAGVYQAGQNLYPDGHYPLKQVLTFLVEQEGPVTFIGDGQHFTEQIKAALPKQVLMILAEGDSLPDGKGIITLAQQAQPVANVADFNPNYLRKTQAELNWLNEHPGEDHPENYVFEV